MSKIKKPIYGPPEIDEEKMTEYEVSKAKRDETLHKIRERRIKKAFKTLRFRGFKNFLFWFFGVLSSIAIIFGSIFIGAKVIPIGTYLKWSGQDESKIVSEDISGKSIFDAIMNFDEYTFSDVPVIEKFVQDLLAETGVDDFVVVDYTALKDVKFLNASAGSDLMDEIGKCIKLNPEAQMFSDIKAFNEYQAVNEPPVEYVNGSWQVKEGVTKSHYCYASPLVGGNQPLLAGSNYDAQVEYLDVFVNGELVDALKDKTEDQMPSVEFYLKPISELPLLDIVNGSMSILSRIEITDILAMVGNGGEVDPLLTKIFGEKSIGDMVSDMDVEGLLDRVMISDLGNPNEIFGQLGALSAFNGEWQEVSDDDKPETEIVDEQVIITKDGDKFTSNPKLYYYLASGTYGNDDAVFERAFDDNGVRVAKVNNDTDLYYANLTKISFGSMLDVIGDSIGTLQMTDLLSTFISDLDEEDLIYKVLEGISINDLGDEFDASTIMDKITIETLGGVDTLGDLGKLSVFKQWGEVETNDKPVLVEGTIPFKDGSTTDFTHHPKLYYYLVSGEHGTDTAVYERAFDNNGVRNESVNDDTPLYYANLSVVSMGEAKR